ncbi:MAG: Pycsar system effector family protein [Mesonia hippocampi]|uniref:Pycsar system effector family protein n=1 Tax=Mesonia hippocampi TaxID=1628250 RepID=UPI003F9970A2
MDSIYQKADDFVFKLFKEQLPSTFLYHNYNHTLRVVKSTKEIIEASEIAPKTQELLLLAAWFHDTGYVKNIKNHEEACTSFVSAFMQQHGYAENDITQVKQCIFATKLTHEPKNLMESIIKDADTSHFSKPYFLELTEFLREELSLHKLCEFTTPEWLEENIKMFTQQHRYYTDYAAKNWKEGKDKNLLILLEKKKKEEDKLAKEKTKAALKAKYKNTTPERSIQTLYRTTLRNHIKLSDIADTKANILLSINAIIISFALGNIVPKLDAPSNRHLMIPTFILICFSVASIVLSIMSTKPNITNGEFTQEQLKNNKINILFFGNFYKMPFEQYANAMDQLIKNKDDIYNALTKDLYLLGIVLNRKYKLLRWTYTIFMTGILISVFSYILAFWLM